MQKFRFLIAMFIGSTIVPSVTAAEDLRISSAIVMIVESVNVPAEQSGVIAQVFVKEGQIVKQGDLLAKILDDTAKLKVERATFDYKIAQRQSKDDTLIKFANKSLEVVRAELERSEQANRAVAMAVSDSEIDHQRLLVSKGVLEVEKAQIEFEVALLTEQLREVELRQTQNELRKHEIRSPLDGQVVFVEKQVGEWVETGNDTFRIVRIDRLRVEGFIGVEQASRGLEDRDCEITVQLPNRPDVVRSGKIVFVSPEANPVDGNIRLWAELDNSDAQLWPGLRAEIVIQNLDELK